MVGFLVAEMVDLKVHVMAEKKAEMLAF